MPLGLRESKRISFYSIVNSSLRFTDIIVRYPSSVHDPRVQLQDPYCICNKEFACPDPLHPRMVSA